MKHDPQDEKAILVALTGADESERVAALHALFGREDLRKNAIAHVRRYGGNRQDGEDVFQEAIIVFDRKLRQGAFLEQGSLSAYFMGIVRWFWYNQRKRSGRLLLSGDEIIPEEPQNGNPELDYLLQERREQIDTLLGMLSEKCRNILRMYQLDYPMEEIARVMDYANAGVAKKEAFLCRKRLRVFLKKVPELWRDRIKAQNHGGENT